MNKIKWGIVGPGFIANKFAEAVKNVDCAELTSVASRTAENGNAFASKHNIKNVFIGYENMAASDKVDAVYIATPHPFHASCAELFMKAGKHVLCEKPLCVTATQAKQLKKCSKYNNIFLMEAVWTRFLPAVNEAVRLARNGVIGDVMGIEADFCYNIEPHEDPKLFSDELAGGSLLDVGVYGLHFASLFFGSSPVTVTATANVVNGVDYHTSILLKYDGGRIASVSSAIKLAKPETAFVYGSKGYILLPHFYGASGLFVNVDGSEHRIEKPFIGNGFEEEIYEVCRCIADGKTESDTLPLGESIAVMRIMDSVRRRIGVRYREDF